MTLDFSFSPDRIKHLLVIGGCAVILVYFLARGILGDSGLVALSRLEMEMETARTERTKLLEAREKLEARTRLLKPGSLDPDMLDERARATLGYTRPNEYVVLFNDK